MFKELDPLLHSQLRLAVMSILLSVEEAGVCLYQGEDERYRRKSQRPIGQT